MKSSSTFVRILLCFFLLLLAAGVSQSHPADLRPITGRVIDRETKQPLPGANVMQSSTTRGTVTNADGSFRLMVSPNGMIVVSMLGYRPDTMAVSSAAAGQEILFRLNPSPVIVPGVTIFSDAPNPADEIMHRVIEAKKLLGKYLESYQFSGYVKTTLDGMRPQNILNQDTVDGAGDSLWFSMVFETMTNGYWTAPDRFKEELVSRRQPKLIPAEYNLFTALRSPNVLFDELPIMDRLIVSPTSPDAFAHYRFVLLDTIADGARVVWKIGVTPRVAYEPLVQGTLWVQDVSFSLVRAHLAGNEQITKPAFHFAGIKQQFAPFQDSITGRSFMMPIETRIRYEIANMRKSNGSADSIMLSASQICLYSDYYFNAALPPDLFDEVRVAVLPTADNGDTTVWEQRQRIPLTEVERRTNTRLDSIAEHPSTAYSAISLLIKAPIVLAKSPLTTMYDYYHFNRVQGSYAGIGLTTNRLLPVTILTGRTGYGIANERWYYGGEVEQFTSYKRRHSVGIEFHRSLQCTDAGSTLSEMTPTIMSLLFRDDPSDYFENEGWSLFARAHIFPRAKIELRFLSERQTDVRAWTDFSLFERANYRINPAIQEGRLQSLAFACTYDSRDYLDFGLFRMPDVSRESWVCEASFEITDRKTLGSDFDFSRILVLSEWNVPTSSNTTLNVKVRGGWSWSALPPQRIFDLVGSSTGFVPDWGFNALKTKEFSGDKCLSLYVEHNLGNVFHRWGDISFLEDYTLSIMGGGAWSDISEESRRLIYVPVQTAKVVYWEAGFGIGGLFDAIQLDFTSRLSHKKGDDFTVGLRTSFL
jgi:hypothetical protein